MRFHVLACDYDGTIAHHGVVDPEVVKALERLKATGRKLVLLTGRELEDLKRVFPQISLFDRVVAENGGVIYRPESRDMQPLAEPPPESFISELRRRQVEPLSMGHVVVATWEPNEASVLEIIRDLGLELQVIFNKGAVMVLPSGVNKRSGLGAALDELGLSNHNCVGVGDAENDHAFLSVCECAVAVKNALPALKELADFSTKGANGSGVSELVELLIADDLRSIEDRLSRHHIPLGKSDDGREVRIVPYGSVVLVAGGSGGGKSTVATAVLECILSRGYQVCVVDPEGDYDSTQGAVGAGSAEHPPEIEQVIQILLRPNAQAVVNLLALPLDDRPKFFFSLLSRLHELRGATGRPHWLIVDEVHHLLHALFEPAAVAFPKELGSLLLVTVDPTRIHRTLLERVGVLIAVGADAPATVAAFADAVGAERPGVESAPEQPGQVLVWQRGQPATTRALLSPSRSVRRRHRRKYAEGELGPDKSFYFRGPGNKLKLRAQNLALFNQLADGVDDETWQFHLRNGDYAAWFRDAIKDEELARETSGIAERDLSPGDSREAVRRAIENRYTLSA